MKKLLKTSLFSVVVLGIAALPVASSFADEVNQATLSHVDEINLSVDAACTLGTINTGFDATTHENGNYTNPQTGETDLGVWGTNDTLYATMQAGTDTENLGSTIFTIRCNNADGYVLQAYGENAEEGEAGADMPARLISGSNYIISGTSGNDSFWNFKFFADPGIDVTSGYEDAHTIYGQSKTVARKESSGTIDGEQVTATYGISLSSSQASGTYTGSVIYTLYQLDGNNPSEPIIPEGGPTGPEEPIPDNPPETPTEAVNYSIIFKDHNDVEMNIPRFELSEVSAYHNVRLTAAPTLSGYTLVGWSIQKNDPGSGSADYAPNGYITLMSDNPSVVLYPVWERIPVVQSAAPPRMTTYNNTYNNYYNNTTTEETVIEESSSEFNEQNEEGSLIRDEDLDIEEDDLESGKTKALGVVATSERDDNWILPAILIALAIAALAGISYYLYVRHEENKEENK